MPGNPNKGKARDRGALEEGARAGKLPGKPAKAGERAKAPEPPWADLEQGTPEPNPEAQPRAHREWLKAEEERLGRLELAQRLGVNPWKKPIRQGPVGSPFTDAHHEAKIALLAEGWLLYRQDREFPGLPSRSSFYAWLQEKPKEGEEGDDRLGRFARANTLCNQLLEEQVLEIADDGTNDYVMGRNGPVLDSEHVTRSKLRIDTRLNLLKIRDRARYGDKQEIEANVRTQVTRKVFRRAEGGAD